MRENRSGLGPLYCHQDAHKETARPSARLTRGVDDVTKARTLERAARSLRERPLWEISRLDGIEEGFGEDSSSLLAPFMVLRTNGVSFHLVLRPVWNIIVRYAKVDHY